MTIFLIAVYVIAKAGTIEAKGLEEKFKIARPKTHHIVLVDTSGSMKDLFEGVQGAVRTLLEGLPREDWITVYRFDDYPVRLCHENYQNLKIDDCIPQTLNSDKNSKTEIGETFEAAITDIEKSDASVFTLFFLTDGKVEPRIGGEFERDPAGSWTRLSQRGQAITASKEIWAYGLGLRQYTDVNLLTKIIPRKQVEVITIKNPADLKARIDDLKDNVRRKWLRSAVMKELKGGFVELAEIEPPSVRGLKLSASYVMKSTYTHLDLEPVSLTAGESVTDLKTGWSNISVPTPGQSRPLSFSFPIPMQSRWRLGRTTIAREEKIDFKAEPQFVDAAEIKKLGLEPKVNQKGFETSIQYSYQTGIPISFIILLPISLVAGALLISRWLKLPQVEVFGLLSATGIPQKDLQQEHQARLSVGGSGRDLQIPNTRGAFEIAVRRKASFDTLFVHPLAGQIQLGYGTLSSEAEEELRDEVARIKLDGQEIILSGVSPRRIRSQPWIRVSILVMCIALIDFVIWHVGP